MIMKKLYSLIISTALAANGLMAQQQPQFDWQQNFGGNNIDFGKSIIQTADGGYLTVGKTWSVDQDVNSTNDGIFTHDTIDFWAVKIDAQGQIEWERAYGGDEDEIAYSVIETFDENFVIAGYTQSNDHDVTENHGYWDAWIIKVNKFNGGIIWEKTYGGSLVDGAHDIIEKADSNLMVVGYTSSDDFDVTENHGDSATFDFWVLELDTNGNLLWEKTYGGLSHEKAFSVIETHDTNYVITGHAESSESGDVSNVNRGELDAWTIKIDALGNLLWGTSLGGSDHELGHSVVETEDRGYAIAGFTKSSDYDVDTCFGYSDAWVYKLTENGNVLWEQNYGGTDYDHAKSIVETYDGHLVVAAYARSNNNDVSVQYGEGDYWVFKINKDNGDLFWDMSFGGSYYDYPYEIIEDDQADLLITGYSASTDFDLTDQNGLGDVWVVRLESNISIEDDQVTSVAQLQEVASVVYPNPTSGIITVQATEKINTLNLYNQLGALVNTYTIGALNKNIDLSNLSKGIYSVETILTNGQKTTNKLIVK